jgi:thiol:disulfide interchange protein
VNCRVNEEKVFPSNKVSGYLQERFIEARLHTDGEKNIDRILELQKELAKSVATPVYLVQDPQSGRVLGEPVGGVVTADSFRAFLERAVEQKERVGRLDSR